MKISLRAFASSVEISAPYYSDIEKGKRYPPDSEKLEKIIDALQLSDEEKIELYDLAAEERQDIPNDIKKILAESENLKLLLRTISSKNVDDGDVQALIYKIERT